MLRGGYGLFYLGTSGGQPNTGFSQATGITSSLDGGNTPRVSLSDAFPEGLLKPIGNSQGLATGIGGGITFGYLNRAIPYSHQYSLGIERLLPGGVVLRATFSGNQTRRYPVSANVNAIPIQPGQDVSYYRERIPNPMAGLLPAYPGLNGDTILRQQLLRPFPQYGGMTMTDIPIGRTGYNSLQMQVTKRYSAGYTLQVSYTLSKSQEQVNFLNAQDFHLNDINSSVLEKRLTEFDVPQKLAVVSTWQLPFGEGRRWGNSWRGAKGALGSGWQINGQLTIQSGFPVDYPNAAPLSNQSAQLPESQRDLFHAFNTSLFPTVAPNLNYTLRTFPMRFSNVRLMPLQNLDISIAKKTRIGERYGLEIRAEFLNATNHPWFSRLDNNGNNVTSSHFGWFQMEEQNQNRLVALVGKLTW